MTASLNIFGLKGKVVSVYEMDRNWWKIGLQFSSLPVKNGKTRWISRISWGVYELFICAWSAVIQTENSFCRKKNPSLIAKDNPNCKNTTLIKNNNPNYKNFDTKLYFIQTKPFNFISCCFLYALIAFHLLNCLIILFLTAAFCILGLPYSEARLNKIRLPWVWSSGTDEMGSVNKIAFETGTFWSCFHFTKQF